MSIPRRDPLEYKRTRIVVQEQNAAGVWLDTQAVMLDRRGPSEAFSSGAMGWYGAGNVPVHGRDGRIAITHIETGSKGFGTPKPKLTAKEKLDRKAEVSGAVKGFYDVEGEQESGRTRGQRIA